MKRVLIVAYYFPPVAASGSLRPLGFCRYLEEYGWVPRVLTADPSSVSPDFDMDEGLCSRVPRSIRIDRIPYVDPLRTLIRAKDFVWRMVRGSCQRRTNGSVASCDQLKKTNSFISETVWAAKEFVLNRLFLFPDPECSWLRPAVRWASSQLQSDPPDVVFATGKPWTALLVGSLLAKRFNVPFIADFRDPWTRNPYAGSVQEFLLTKAQELERAICTAAARVVVNTRELRDQLAADYPELEKKIVTIPNGFDQKQSVHTRSVPELRGEALELCHFGTLYGRRNPLSVLLALQALYAEGKIGTHQIRMRFIGYWNIYDDFCNRLANELEEVGLLRREPPMPYEACIGLMHRAHTLLAIQPASPLQVPGKLYEYIAAGRPLLVIGGEGATASLVERYSLGRCCPNNAPAIKQLLTCLINGEIRLKPPQLTDSARFHYRNLTRELATLLDAVCDERSSVTGTS